jgi:hypothetical protein
MITFRLLLIRPLRGFCLITHSSSSSISSLFRLCRVTRVLLFHPLRPKCSELLTTSRGAVLVQHLGEECQRMPFFVADICPSARLVQISHGDKGRHPRKPVHNVQCLRRQKRHLGPIGTAGSGPALPYQNRQSEMAILLNYSEILHNTLGFCRLSRSHLSTRKACPGLSDF